MSTQVMWSFCYLFKSFKKKTGEESEELVRGVWKKPYWHNFFYTLLWLPLERQDYELQIMEYGYTSFLVNMDININTWAYPNLLVNVNKIPEWSSQYTYLLKFQEIYKCTSKYIYLLDIHTYANIYSWVDLEMP